MSKRKTQEEFEKEVYDLVEEEYTVLGEYKNTETKIKMKHNNGKCNNYEWEIRPYDFLRGSRCPICSAPNLLNRMKKTQEQFEKEIYDLEGNDYTVLGKYKNTETKIKMRHNNVNCNNHEWDVRPQDFLRGSRCPICSSQKLLNRFKKTQKQFEKEVFDLVGEEYIVLGEYKAANTKIKMKHNTCGCEYEVKPNSFLRGNRCPKCFGTPKKTQEQFEQEVFDLVGEEYIVLGEYKNTKTKIKMRHDCEKCKKYEFEMTPDSFLLGQRCPKCAGNIKKTQEEFEKEVYDLVGNEYKVLGEYKNTNTKIKIKHNTCGYEFEMSPNHFLRGCRCPKCFGTPKKTQEEFENEVYSLVGDNYSVIGQYNGRKEKIKMRHNNKGCCNYEYEVSPSNFLKGNRCPKCFGTIKKNQEDFKKEIYDLVGDEYTILEPYINNNTKIQMRHNTCGNEYEVKPNSFLRGCRCPWCSGKIKKTQELFEKEIYNLTGDEYTVLGEYINNNTKIVMKHNTCGCEYEVRPCSFLRGQRCPKCFGTPKKTQEQFDKEIYDLVGNEYTVVGTYKNTDSKIRMRHNCDRCNNYEWEVRPHDFLKGSRCPKCRESKGEKAIYDFLEKEDVRFTREYKTPECRNVNLLPFDFAIFDREGNVKLLIEYQGGQHYKMNKYFHKEDEKFVKRIMTDCKKRAYCEYNNIPLLEISYTDFDKIEEILTDVLKK